MRIRVIHCDSPEHPLPWVLVEHCTHWSMTCPRARRKKPRHKLIRSLAGFDVDMTGVDEEGWPYDREPTEAELALVPKRYLGSWEGPDASRWVPAPSGNLVTCATGCGLKGSL